MRLHILCCGYMRVSESVPYGGSIDLHSTRRLLLDPDAKRLTLPVFAYLIEHPRGLVLVDTGWCRAISPEGCYDAGAVKELLPGYLASLYRPWLPEGMAVHEQLEAMGVRPEDMELLILTHLDPDHVSALKSVNRAKRILLPEDEYFWACRTVYKLRQPWCFWIDQSIERPYYQGSSIGPNHWVIDVFGDESILLVNVPGATDGQAAVLIRSGPRFVLLAADAAYSPRNWQEGITPGLGFSPQWQRKSLDWLKTMSEDPGCAAILCSHDPAVRPGVLEF